MSPNRKLGRKTVLTDTRTLRLARYFTAALAPPPVSRDWTCGITSWGELLNDTLGDCTSAGKGHAIQVWSANTGVKTTITDSMALLDYEACCGYNPNNPASDQGGIELNTLKSWQQGIGGFAPHKLLGFAVVSPMNQTHIQQAIELFGGLYIGFEVPQFALPDGPLPAVWDVEPNADNTIVGGHCVYIAQYDADGLTCITWGGLQKMTWAFWNQFVDEAYALISPDWIAAKGLSPSGFALADLESDLEAVTN